MAIKAITTAVVVDSPTPFAPPLVVKPQLQPIMAIIPPKITRLNHGADQIPKLDKSIDRFNKSCLGNIVKEISDKHAPYHTHY